jgi:L-threonylcarbamoyladenylate synthase
MSSVYSYSNESIRAISSAILDGGVVIFPTETVYALACDATNLNAVEKIYQIKSRSAEMPLSVLVPDVDFLSNYTNFDYEFISLINHFSPGPITYVLNIVNIGQLVPRILLNNSVGFRIPDHKISLEILCKVRLPLVATSVNISGQPAASKFDQIPSEILSQVDSAIQDDVSVRGVASTVIKFDQSEGIKLLREGPISLKSLQDFIDEQ